MKWLKRASTYLSAVGSVCLLAIVVIVTTGVVMRYVFEAPLLGINEIVQLTAVALVMSALPYCTLREDHVAVDVFENWIGASGRLIGDVLSRFFAGFILTILSHRAILRAYDAWEFHDITNMLRMPIWPFYVILATGAGIAALIFIAQLVLIIIRRGQ